jgi:DNA-binding NarL/FixJ family response regulator
MISENGSGSQGLGTGSLGNASPPGQPPMWTDERPVSNYAESLDNIAPLSITSKIPSRNAGISIAVIDKHLFTRESITRSLQNLWALLEIQSFATCDECLNGSKSFDVILYHAHQAVIHNDNDGLNLSVRKLLPVAPVIILCDVDSFDSICAAFNSGVRGYIPTISTNLELAIEIIYLVKVGGTFVPPNGLSQRRVKPLGTFDPVTTQFTTRQLAVLDCLKLGKTNKIIAYELEMSESSVKAHIRNIMRKMNATNRTEVVSRAHELEMTAAD